MVSPSIDLDDSGDELYMKRAKKKKAISGTQAEMTDFFDKARPVTKKAPAPRKISRSMKPASPPKPKLKKVPVKESDDSDDDALDYGDFVKPPTRSVGLSRAARSAPKKYVEILSDDEEEEKDESTFED